MLQQNRGFTLVELMVVILIIGILAAITVPLMKGRIDKSKWSEACTSAGTIRTAIRNYASETSVTNAQKLNGAYLNDPLIQNTLDFATKDLDGTYFSPGDYEITSVNSDGIAEITVTGGSKTDSPSGSYILQTDGKWIMK